MSAGATLGAGAGRLSRFTQRRDPGRPPNGDPGPSPDIPPPRIPRELRAMGAGSPGRPGAPPRCTEVGPVRSCPLDPHPLSASTDNGYVAVPRRQAHEGSPLARPWFDTMTAREDMNPSMVSGDVRHRIRCTMSDSHSDSGAAPQPKALAAMRCELVADATTPPTPCLLSP